LIDEDLHAHPYLEAPDLFHAAANAIRGLPIWVFHSATDKVVPVEESRRLVSALKEIDADVRYTEYKDLDHNATNRQAWSEKSLSHWLFAQRRLSSTHKPTTKPE
jgi:predicted peptidase